MPGFPFGFFRSLRSLGLLFGNRGRRGQRSTLARVILREVRTNIPFIIQECCSPVLLAWRLHGRRVRVFAVS
jgi:hypothetical protein